MKKLLFGLLVVTSFAAQAQVNDPVPHGNGNFISSEKAQEIVKNWWGGLDVASKNAAIQKAVEFATQLKASIESGEFLTNIQTKAKALAAAATTVGLTGLAETANNVAQAKSLDEVKKQLNDLVIKINAASKK